MKKLIILRHAKSSWENVNLSDYNRPLSKRGLMNAEQMGKFLLAKEGIPDLILSSSSTRTYETAKIAAQEIGYDIDKIRTDRQLYLAWVNEIINAIITIPDNVQKCILIGHNPGFTDLVNYFGVKLDNLPTASAACFEFDTNSWKKISKNNAQLAWFQLARKL